jgi:flagellar biosynthesis protein FliR
MTEAFFLQAVGTYLIALVRFSGFFLNMPVFSESIMPMRVKAGLAALGTALVLPHLLATQPLPDLPLPTYGFMALKELGLGFTLGFVVLITFDALRFAGELIGMQIGFSFVQVADPMSNRSHAILAEIFQLTTVLLFLIFGGHILMLQAFAQSFDLVPLAGMKWNGGIVAEIVWLSRSVFKVGLQISMPIVGVILVGDVGLGIIARTVPRMNIFQVGFAMKILMGIFVLTLLLPFFPDLIRWSVHEIFGQINTLLNHLG